MNQSAQGLASLGRNGDSMLVHMNPEELQGLQGLAMAQGGSLTINPDTGLPEAFKIKNLFKAALPIAAGFMFPQFGTQFMGGMFGKGVAAGALAGAGISALSGENPLLGALTGGLGGYGGAGLAGSAANVGKGTIANVADDIVAVPSMPAQGAGASGAMGFSETGQTALSGLAPGQGGLSLQTAAPNAIKDVVSTTTPLEIAGENFGTLMKNPLDVIKDYGYGSSAMLAGGPLLAGMEPSDLGYGPGNLYEDPDKGKYRGPQGQLNLSDRFDTGLRLAAEGGYIDGYATGGTIQSGGIRDLYGTPDNQPTISPGLSGFGLGRLNNLAGEQAMTQAQTLGYDEGGAVGSGDASGDVSGDAVTAETTSAPADYASMSYDALVASGIHPMNAAALKGMPMPGMSSPAPSTYTGSGSSTSGISSLAPSMSYMPTTSYGTGTPEYIGGMPSASYIESMGYRGGMPSPDYIESMGYSGGMPSPSLSAGFGGLRKRIDYAKGGYLDGQGDGMSDSIPATIEGKQPARLADGEFVIPADVVSHIGNGSSKAGSKRLYAMLDKVRHARTGNKKQGKEINPAKYMPA